MSDNWLGFTVASALLGTILGSISVGRPTDRMGRRKMLIWLAILYFVSAVGSAIAWNWYSFLVFRFIGGSGGRWCLRGFPHVYRQDLPGKESRTAGGPAQFNIVLGILLAFISNYVITILNLGAAEWRWMFGVEAVPAACFSYSCSSIPYSPRWLMSKGRRVEARAVLERLEPDPMIVEEELQAIQESLDLEHHSLRESLLSAKYLRPILLACTIAVFNQLSGINAVLYYAPRVFKMTGAAGSSTMLQSVIIGLVNLVFTMAALAAIDRFGRKRLMLAGSLGYVLSLAVISWTFFTYSEEFQAATDAMEAVVEAQAEGIGGEALADLRNRETLAIDEVGKGGMIVLCGLIVFIASHAFGQGAVIWVFISEIFPEPGAGSRPGVRQLHTLVHGSGDFAELPDDCRGIRRPRVRFLRGDDGSAITLGPAGHARNEGRPAGRNPEETAYRVGFVSRLVRLQPSEAANRKRLTQRRGDHGGILSGVSPRITLVGKDVDSRNSQFRSCAVTTHLTRIFNGSGGGGSGEFPEFLEWVGVQPLCGKDRITAQHQNLRFVAPEWPCPTGREQVQFLRW